VVTLGTFPFEFFCSVFLLADKHTRKKAAKLTKKNRTEKHKWKRGNCNHVQERAKKKQRSSRFLQGHESKNIIHA
jgi:hypothetical protein